MQTVETDAPAARHAGGRESARSVTRSGEALLAEARLLGLQQSAGNRAVSGLVQRWRAVQPVTVQRTIDKDARTWAMDWLATWTRSFPKAVKRYQLPKLYSICTGVMGPEQPPVPAPPPLTPEEQAKRTEERARYTTALAAGLVSMGEKSAGELSARVDDGKPGLDKLMQELDRAIPDEIPQMKLSTQVTADAHRALRLDDPFLKLESGGAVFSFSRAMAEHMMRRHHPGYLVGPPLQVQSFFDEDTTIPQIKAIIEGTVNNSKAEIAAWRKFRGTRGTVLASSAATTLNLRPFWDGRYWELTLSIESDNPPGKPREGRALHSHVVAGMWDASILVLPDRAGRCGGPCRCGAAG